MPRQVVPDHRDRRAFFGLTARRRQLGLPVSECGPRIHVRATLFLGGPLAGRRRRLIAAPARWAVYAHRQAIGVVEVRHLHETRLQPELWERFIYERVADGEGWATYRLQRNEELAEAGGMSTSDGLGA
jgi:hypothetical protein